MTADARRDDDRQLITELTARFSKHYVRMHPEVSGWGGRAQLFRAILDYTYRAAAHSGYPALTATDADLQALSARTFKRKRARLGPGTPPQGRAITNVPVSMRQLKLELDAHLSWVKRLRVPADGQTWYGGSFEWSYTGRAGGELRGQWRFWHLTSANGPVFDDAELTAADDIERAMPLKQLLDPNMPANAPPDTVGDPVMENLAAAFVRYAQQHGNRILAAEVARLCERHGVRLRMLARFLWRRRRAIRHAAVVVQGFAESFAFIEAQLAATGTEGVAAGRHAPIIAPAGGPRIDYRGPEADSRDAALADIAAAEADPLIAIQFLTTHMASAGRADSQWDAYGEVLRLVRPALRHAARALAQEGFIRYPEATINDAYQRCRNRRMYLDELGKSSALDVLQRINPIALGFEDLDLRRATTARRSGSDAIDAALLHSARMVVAVIRAHHPLDFAIAPLLEAHLVVVAAFRRLWRNSTSTRGRNEAAAIRPLVPSR